jgi:hypothetical protein
VIRRYDRRARKRRRRQRVLVVAGILVALAAAVAVVVGGVRGTAPSAGGPGSPSVNASSWEVGYEPAFAADGREPGWHAEHQTVGAWITVSWPTARRVTSVTVRRPSWSLPGVTWGTLTFGDGSVLQMRLTTSSRTTTVPVAPRMVHSVRFTVAGVAARTATAVLTRFAVGARDASVQTDPDGDAAPGADVTVAPTSTPMRAVGAGGPVWTTADAVGTTLTFTWARPRELDLIAITGAGGFPATIASATLRFADGSAVPIGGVPGVRRLPTVVAFAPRVTRSVRLTIDTVSGAGALAVARIRFGEHGYGAASASSASASGVAVTAAAAGDCSGAGEAAVAAFVVACPGDGDRVGDQQDLVVDVPAAQTVLTVTAWAASGSATIPTISVSGAGRLVIPLRLGALPDGPILVRVAASTSGRPPAAAQLQLLHGTTPAGRSASSGVARGRTVVYDEEFDAPVTVSRTGAGAEYAAAKPQFDGVSDFGDAVFGDPAAGFGNVGVLKDGYLRITASPLPSGTADPQGFGRTAVGGLLASARPGGSGFSAQYGYFEARMLAPAMPGTWPAFWLLPSTGLIAQQRTTAEIDAIELYGQDPTGGCNSTHQYVGIADGGVAACGARFPSVRAAAQWHTYGVDVTPTRIVFFIDGTSVASAPQVVGGGKPMFFLADLALGGGWPVDLGPTRGHAQLLIDWIRVSE